MTDPMFCTAGMKVILPCASETWKARNVKWTQGTPGRLTYTYTSSRTSEEPRTHVDDANRIEEDSKQQHLTWSDSPCLESKVSIVEFRCQSTSEHPQVGKPRH